MAKWFQRNPTRLVLEKQAMKKKFPKFELGKQSDGFLQWTGGVDRENGRSYEIRVVYSDDFPAESPEVQINGVGFDLHYGFDLHRSSNGWLCLFTKGYKPGTVTACALVDRTVEWIKNYEEWERSRKWPGKVNIAHKITSATG